MAPCQGNNSSSPASIEGPVKYGELTVLYASSNDFLPDGDEARTESHFTLYQRATANGVKPSTVHKDCNPQEATAISISDQHSVSYKHSDGSTTVVKYAPDNDTDMFQIGRSTLNDFVVTETEADSQPSALSRFACRIICQRSPPYTARIYAAGFDHHKRIGVSAVKWTTTFDGRMDGLTSNGVLVLHPSHRFTQEPVVFSIIRNIHTDITTEPGLWREISVCGNVFTVRKTESERGEMVDSGSHELVDGSLIDLCGVTLQWRTAEGLARTPTAQHLEVQRGLEHYPGRPCLVYKVLISSIYSGLLRELTSDAKDYTDSWCQTVEPGFRKKQDTREVKRQNVIYELMQTERSHLETLLVMANVFRHGLRYQVQLDAEALERLVPCLDQLVLLHHDFFRAMKERRHSSTQPPEDSSTQPPGHSSYLIQQIGDILLKQFSDEKAQRMKQAYGEFCSRQKEAVSFFTELKLKNKDFQDFIKKQPLGPTTFGDPRLHLAGVTQRITKYPVLLAEILKHTLEDTEEHADMVRALFHMREVISAVDLRVGEYQQDQPLRDVLNRMENSSSAKLKNGLAFRKQDLAGQRHKHQGRLQLKTAKGKLKDVLVLLLSDTLVFLKYKNQKYKFATVDEKPPVVSLQELTVTEVANEERGMNLIIKSGAGTQVYEVLTSAQDERNTWMRLITEAIESLVKMP